MVTSTCFRFVRFIEYCTPLNGITQNKNKMLKQRGPVVSIPCKLSNYGSVGIITYGTG